MRQNGIPTRASARAYRGEKRESAAKSNGSAGCRRHASMAKQATANACAVTVAWILDRRIPTREAIVRLDGGDLRIAWPADDAEVRMEGEAVTVFEGEWK